MKGRTNKPVTVSKEAVGSLYCPEKLPETNPQPTKHDRGEFKSDESKELQGKPKSKKQKSISRDNLGFACHFNKRNPQKYCPWTGQKYLQCITPNSPNFAD
jgi:hypothetical protein